MKNRNLIGILLTVTMMALVACNSSSPSLSSSSSDDISSSSSSSSSEIISSDSSTSSSSNSSSSDSVSSSSQTSSSSSSSSSTSNSSSSTPTWDGASIYYSASNIKTFGSGTPIGVATYESGDDTVVIWNTDASLDNYGGIQTPRLALDFSKSVIFEMYVVRSYSQYIVKLAVEGESEYYYVLSDEGTSGLISINVVDAMLSTKYRERNTQPDPGYQTGWKYANQTKNCTFHILAKGPDGERQTAELVIGHLAVYNNQPAVTSVQINSVAISDGKIERLKDSASLSLTATVLPTLITDQTVLWASDDENVATISSVGQLDFVGVGVTTISAKSRIDQSKIATISVNVTSGYENTTLLKNKLETLTYDGETVDSAIFLDLFKTTWGTSIRQDVVLEDLVAIDTHIDGDTLTIENYFSPSTSSHINEAQARLTSQIASANLTLSSVITATVYRYIDGGLYQEAYSSALKVKYALNQSGWERVNPYKEYSILVTESGGVYKYDLNMLGTSLLGTYQPSDFTNTSLWTIPDRTKQTQDPVIHALSPAALTLVSNQLVMKQNKYPEAKYCFGGIVSPLYQTQLDTVQILLNIAALNQMNDFVKTMWEIKILYYQANGTTVVSSNPLKVASGNTIGTHIITFNPAHDNFRLYLVVNGSDIGAQFANAELRLNHMKLYGMA